MMIYIPLGAFLRPEPELTNPSPVTPAKKGLSIPASTGREDWSGLMDHLRSKEKAMPREQCFYVVWRIGGEAPTRTHDSYDAAKTEARRLALKCRGEKFAVLKSVSSHVSHEVLDTEHSEDFEPPF
jgi:hypothetical protein